jgi:hypothetical protein
VIVISELSNGCTCYVDKALKDKIQAIFAKYQPCQNKAEYEPTSNHAIHLCNAG